MRFTREQLQLLSDVLWTHQDEGPPGAGWASGALSKLRAEVDVALAEPEPEGPTDQELLEVLDRATADFPPNHPEAESMTGVRYALALELRKARAVLSMRGTPSSRSN